MDSDQLIFLISSATYLGTTECLAWYLPLDELCIYLMICNLESHIFNVKYSIVLVESSNHKRLTFNLPIASVHYQNHPDHHILEPIASLLSYLLHSFPDSLEIMTLDTNVSTHYSRFSEQNFSFSQLDLPVPPNPSLRTISPHVQWGEKRRRDPTITRLNINSNYAYCLTRHHKVIVLEVSNQS